MKRFFCLFLCFLTFGSAVAQAHEPLEEHNSIIVCDNGLEMFGWDLEFIAHAAQSIDISACFLGGEIARELLAAIEARLEVCPALQVRILATPILLEREDYKIIERLKKRFPNNFHMEHATNVTIVWPDVTGIDNHVKMCVVDEKYFSMGGTNLDESQCSEGTYTPVRENNKLNVIGKNLPAGMRDQDIVGRGPMAKELRICFCKLFALWKDYNDKGLLERDPERFANNRYYFEITEQPFVARFEAAEALIHLNKEQMRYFLSGPHQKKNVITQEYIRLIKQAKKEIKIANLYLAPVDELMDALMDAVKRGVKLTVITNGLWDKSPEFAKYFCWANRMSYVPLFHGQTYHFWDYWSVKKKKPKNTRIFEYHVDDILLHKKLIIVDDTIFALGSYNLGVKSHLADYETLMVIRSAEAVKAANQVYARDLQHSREVKHEDAVSWYFDPAIAYIGEIQRRFHGLL